MPALKERSKKDRPYREIHLRSRNNKNNYKDYLKPTEFDELIEIVISTSMELDEIVRYLTKYEITLQTLNLYSLKNKFIKEYKKTQNPIYLFRILAIAENMFIEFEKKSKKYPFNPNLLNKLLKLYEVMVDFSNNMIKYFYETSIRVEGRQQNIVEIYYDLELSDNFLKTKEYLTNGTLSGMNKLSAFNNN